MWEWAREGTHLDDPDLLSAAVMKFAAAEEVAADRIAAWADGVRGKHDLLPPSRVFVEAAKERRDELTDDAQVALWADGQTFG